MRLIPRNIRHEFKLYASNLNVAKLLRKNNCTSRQNHVYFRKRSCPNLVTHIKVFFSSHFMGDQSYLLSIIILYKQNNTENDSDESIIYFNC